MMGVSSRSIKVYECDQCGSIREKGDPGFEECFEITGDDTGHILIRTSDDAHFSLCDDDEEKWIVDSLCFCSPDCLAKFVAAAIEQHKGDK